MVGRKWVAYSRMKEKQKKKYKRKNLVKLNDDNMARVQE